MRRIPFLLLLALIVAPLAFAVTPVPPKLYISGDRDFATALSAAMTKKKVPVTVLADDDGADYTLEPSVVNSHQESTGSKIARCVFINCIGIEGNSSVSVQLIRNKDNAVVWAYQVRKGMSGPMGIQSLSEAIAKHLKNDYLEKQVAEAK